jgi:hypothetical protein
MPSCREIGIELTAVKIGETRTRDTQNNGKEYVAELAHAVHDSRR